MTPVNIDPAIAIAKYSKLQRRAQTALGSARDLGAQVRELTAELTALQIDGIPEPPPHIVAKSGYGPVIAGEVRSPSPQSSRVAQPPVVRGDRVGELALDPRSWVERWNSQQRRIRAILGELDDIEPARDEASATWHELGRLAASCRQYLARHQIRVEA